MLVTFALIAFSIILGTCGLGFFVMLPLFFAGTAHVYESARLNT